MTMLGNCAHGLSYGFCDLGCKAEERQEHIARCRKRLAEQFPEGSGVDRVSLIRAYQALHFAESYPWGVPENLIRPHEIVRILT